MKGVRIPRTTRAYLIVIVVLSGVFAAQEMRTPHRNAIPIPDIAAEVDRIVMEEDASDGEPARVAIYREQDTWRIRANEDAPRSYRADSTTIESLLQNLAELSAVDVISTRANYEEYGLTAGETRRLRFFVGDTEPVALQFGATAAAGESVYARINGSREIVLVPRSLARAVTTDLDQLRDTAVVRLPEEQITQVEIRSREHETLTVSRQRPGDSSAAAAGEGDPVWRVEPAREDESIAPGRVRDLFTELNPLRAQDFLSEEPQGSPFAEIVVRRSDDGSTEEIRIWPPDDDRAYPVRASSAEETVRIPEWRARRLLLGLERYFAPFVESEPATE